MTDGLFNCSAYKVYGKIMVDESYAKVGQMAVLGLKDANLALEAGGICRRCRCRAATSGATGWSARSPTATATRTGR